MVMVNVISNGFWTALQLSRDFFHERIVLRKVLKKENEVDEFFLFSFHNRFSYNIFVFF